MRRRRWLADTSANHMAQSSWNANDYEGTLVPHLVQTAYPITLFAILHMYEEKYSLHTICLP